MSVRTPGQAAYEAYDEHMVRLVLPWSGPRGGWETIGDGEQAAWQAAMQAAIDVYAQRGAWPERAAEILRDGKP